MALFGVVGAIYHGVPLQVTMVGALLGLKLWIMVVTTLLLPWTPQDVPRLYGIVIKVGLLVAALGLLDYVTHGIVSRTLHTSNAVLKAGAFRSEAVQSIFPTPGEFSLFMSILFAVTFARFANHLRKPDLLLALIFAGSVLLSLRLKGVLSLVAVIAIVGAVQGATSWRRAIISLLAGIVLIAGGYALEGNVITAQVSTYTSSKESVRAILYNTSEKIAASNFPIGVGFGRYASYPSRIYYSPVYFQYKLNRVYGLSPSYPHYIDDTSWPSVIGESGYGGFATYVVGLVLMVVTLCRKLRSDEPANWLVLATVCSIAVILADSLGDPTLFSWLATSTLALLLGPALMITRSARNALDA